MKKILTLFIAISSLSVSAQEKTEKDTTEKKVNDWSLDMGMWGGTSNNNKKFTPSSWNMAYWNDNLIEVRYNFDNTNTVSTYYGRRFGKTTSKGADLSITPALGFQFATDGTGYTGVALTTHSIAEIKWFKFYTINQYQVDVSGGDDHMFYNWIDLTFWVTDWLNFGASDQIFYGDDFSYDVGPSIGFEVGKFYGKAYGWDLWDNDERYFGVWFGIYLSSN
jgi:hypothetical protein